MIKQLLQGMRRQLAASGVYARKRARRQRNGVGSLTILMYHRVEIASPGNARLSVPASRFDAQLQYLAQHYEVIEMDHAVTLIRDGAPPPRDAVAITFDDGYIDNVTHALPLLRKHDLPALVYVVPGFAGTEKLFWWDSLGILLAAAEDQVPPSLRERPWYAGRLRELIESSGGALPLNHRVVAATDELDAVDPERRDAILAEWAMDVTSDGGSAPDGDHRTAGWGQLRELSDNGVEIGCHSMTHANLSRAPDEVVRRELANARSMIEEKLGRPARHLAYPYGQAEYLTSQAPALAREAGFDSACLAIPGACIGSDLFALPRIYAGDHDLIDFEILLGRTRVPLAARD